MAVREKTAYHTARLIREGLENYPGGICFAAADGRPILVNQQMNAIYCALTGHTVTNTLALWPTLGAKALEREPEQLTIATPDRRVWQFQRQELFINDAVVTQFIAADITELYAYRNQLRERNAKAAELHERQRELIRNIVRNNRDRELLSAKMRLHDAFGRLLVVTRRTLGDPDPRQRRELIRAWGDLAGDLRKAAQRPSSPMAELTRIAGLIGCPVTFQGPQPTETKALRLLYAAIREALTNAVRHAGADRLSVKIREDAAGYDILISSNGRPAAGPIREGGGLSSLRQRLEQDGAELDIRYDPGVALALKIPKE